MGLTSPKPVGDSGIYLLRTRGLRAPSSPNPGVSLGGLVFLAESTVLGGFVPRTEHASLGGLPVTSTAFHNFHTHEPRIRTDGLSAPPGRFVARVSAFVATTQGCTGRGLISPAVDTVFASVFAIPIEGGTGSAEALDAATPIAQQTYLFRNSTQEAAPAATTGSTVSVSYLLGTPAPPSSTMRRRTATATGDAPSLYIMDSDPRGPSAIFQTRYNPAASPTAAAHSAAAATLALADSPARTMPLPSDRDHAEPIWELLSYGSRLLLGIRRLHIQGRTPLATLLNCCSLIPLRVIHMTIGSESTTLSRRGTP